MSAMCRDCALQHVPFLVQQTLRPLGFSRCGSRARMQPPESVREERFRARGRLQVGEGRGQKGGVEDRISGSLSSSSWCLQQTEDEWPSTPQTSEGRERV